MRAPMFLSLAVRYRSTRLAMAPASDASSHPPLLDRGDQPGEDPHRNEREQRSDVLIPIPQLLERAEQHRPLLHLNSVAFTLDTPERTKIESDSPRPPPK